MALCCIAIRGDRESLKTGNTMPIMTYSLICSLICHVVGMVLPWCYYGVAMVLLLDHVPASQEGTCPPPAFVSCSPVCLSGSPSGSGSVGALRRRC